MKWVFRCGGFCRSGKGDKLNFKLRSWEGSSDGRFNFSEKRSINYIDANPGKAKLVKTARDYYWSSFRSFYSQGDEPVAVDHDWWWPDDAKKLAKAMKELGWHSYWKRDGDE